MAKIPKYVEKLLNRREKLAEDLRYVCNKLDYYCYRIGIDDPDEAILLSHIMIYTEPNNSKEITRQAILKRLEEMEHEHR